MMYKNDWHVLGITGDVKATTLVVGSESDCRMIAKLLVSSGQWDNAWVYPPGSYSGADAKIRHHDRIPVGRHEVYTVRKSCGEMPSEMLMDWRGYDHHKFDGHGDSGSIDIIGRMSEK